MKDPYRRGTDPLTLGFILLFILFIIAVVVAIKVAK
jgi:hypothetical protein